MTYTFSRKVQDAEEKRLLRDGCPVMGKIVDKKWRGGWFFGYRFFLSYEFEGKSFQGIPSQWLTVPSHIIYEFLNDTYPYVWIVVDADNPKNFVIREFADYKSRLATTATMDSPST